MEVDNDPNHKGLKEDSTPDDPDTQGLKENIIYVNNTRSEMKTMSDQLKVRTPLEIVFIELASQPLFNNAKRLATLFGTFSSN